MSALIALGGLVLVVWGLAVIGRRFSLSGMDMFVRAIVVVGTLALTIYAAAFVFRFWPAVVVIALVALGILAIQGLASLRRH